MLSVTSEWLVKNLWRYLSQCDILIPEIISDGDFFVTDWLRNRNTLEYIGIWEKVYNPDFNYGEFAIIKSQAGLNSYKLVLKNGQKRQMQLE